MEKNLIIAILVIIVLVMLLWSGKSERPDNQTPEVHDKRPQIMYKSPSDAPTWTQPPRPYVDPQYSPAPGEYQPYMNMPNQIYGMPQPQLYGVPQTFPGVTEQSPLYPQQPYNNWQYPQYVGPRYRFRNPNRVDSQNPYQTNRHENYDGGLDYRSQPNIAPLPNQDRYVPYQQPEFFNNSPGSQPYIPPQNNNYRGGY